MRPIDLTGQKFNRWTVIARSENTAQGQATWLCRCVCGKEKTIKSIVIRRGLSQSCGCLKLEVLVARSTKHGHANSGAISPTYWTWAGMVARCTQPSHKNYHRYGGRGIRVCERWHQFENFLADMGEKPAGKSLDRKNNDGNYEPENCKWSTDKEQARNKSNNRLITIGDKTKTMAEWCEIKKIKAATVWDRIDNGWPEVEALCVPANDYLTMLTHNGETLPITEWAKRSGVNRETLRKRIYAGWPMADALIK